MESITNFDELQIFLSNNYIADPSGALRFNYSKDILEWAIKIPGYHPEWLLCYRIKNELIGVIVASPIKIGDAKFAVINFLCVRHDHRELGTARLLIDEITRRVKEKGITNSLYTRGVSLSNKIVDSKVLPYYHYIIDYEYLCEIGLFPKNLNYKHKYDLNQPLTLRLVNENDIPVIHKKLCGIPNYTIEELKHQILPRNGVIYSFISDDHEMFVSYFIIESSLGLKKTPFRVAYSYYNYGLDKDLLQYQILISAKQQNCCQFNTLFPFGNKLYPGTGGLKYFKNEIELDPNEVKIILV